MILVTGSLAFDFIMNFPGRFSDHILAEKIHRINLSFLVQNLRSERGGCGANIAYNLALLGERPLLFGVLGKDGRKYKKWLADQGIDVSRLSLSKSFATSSAFIMTDKMDNQITGFYPGAMAEGSKLRIENCKLKIENLDLVVIAPNNPQAMINFARQCQELKIPYLFDPGMQLPVLSNQDLLYGIKGAKIIIGNDYEMGLITARLSAGQAKSQIWITTLGEKGSLIETGGKRIKIKAAKPQTVLDPTGAGDAYRAGFVYGYVKGFDLKTCGQIGSLCAVYTVEKYGTTTHHFTKKQFIRRYQTNFKEKINF